MKYKVYLILLTFVMILGINNVQAYNKDYIKQENINVISNNINYKPFFLYNQKFGIDGYNNNNNNNSQNTVTCDQLIDQSVRDLLNDVLKYPKYIVPIIIILLGTIDMFKAVTAGKEDEMSKALKTLIKRIIIGILIFLVPVFLNVIIWLANLAWEGLGFTTCPM